MPQAADLEAHLAKLRETVVQWIPDPTWDGVAGVCILVSVVQI